MSNLGTTVPNTILAVTVAHPLTGFWAQDVWRLQDCPLAQGTTTGTQLVIRFECRKPQFKLQLKVASQFMYEQGKWSLTNRTVVTALHQIMAWLNKNRFGRKSLLDAPLDRYELSLRAWLLKRTRNLKPALSVLRQVYAALEQIEGDGPGLDALPPEVLSAEVAQLEYQGIPLTGFWASDTWDLRCCPLAQGAGVTGPRLTVSFECYSQALNTELKYGCWQKYQRREWKLAYAEYVAGIQQVIQWLNQTHPATASLLENPLHFWELSFSTWLLKHRTVKASGAVVLRQVYRKLEEAQADKLGFERVIVPYEHIGLATDLAKVHGATQLNFSRIPQPWLYTAAKTYLAWRSVTMPHNTLRAILGAVTEFAIFLAKFQAGIGPSEIDRTVILKYLADTSDLGHTPGTRFTRLSVLRTFLELSSREGIAPFPEKRIIYDDDFPVVPQSAPRAIPPEVLAQLMEALNPSDLCRPTPTQQPLPGLKRLILLLANCGMRVSEALTMPFDCLEKDADGDWFLRYYQSKVRCEQTQPISPQTAALVQAQQTDVQNQSGTTPPWLFVNREGNPFTARAVHWWLTALQERHHIRDAAGQAWHFHPHQFRHTFATMLINRGMSLYEVQLMLGHKSPEMTQRYARVHHETLKQKYKAALEARTLVDLSGKVYREENPDDAAELKILKQGFTAQTLPHGWCAYPVALGSCPHSNACFTCKHWRTDHSKLPILQTQLDETHTLIAKATEQGWQRVVEMNTTVAHNLTRVIQVLKGDDDGTSTQH